MWAALTIVLRDSTIGARSSQTTRPGSAGARTTIACPTTRTTTGPRPEQVELSVCLASEINLICFKAAQS